MIEGGEKVSVPVGYVMDGKGRFVPEKMVREDEKLTDEVVREIVENAERLQALMAEFKQQASSDVLATLDIICERYAVRRPKSGGAISLVTYDGMQKVTLTSDDREEFGPELHAAKALVDECIQEWSDGTNDNLKALINGAFSSDGQGKLSKTALFGLFRYPIQDERWVRAMDALRNAIRVVGTSTYLRVYKRPAIGQPYQQVPLDISKL